MNKGQLRINSLIYLGLAIVLLVFYRIMFVYGWFSDSQRSIAAFVLSAGALVLSWMALQLFKKGVPTGSNLGCIYLVLVVLTLILSAVALFFALTFYFSLG